MADTSPASLLLQLPDPCLLAVLGCLADDPASLFSAARAHSRLHQAAGEALSSITVTVKTQQQLDHSLLPYLGKHGQHVNSMTVRGDWDTSALATVRLRQLPTCLHLTSLRLKGQLCVQLQQGHGFQGVLRHGLPLKQLRFGIGCTLLDAKGGLAAALHELPVLQHLKVTLDPELAASVLPELQHLTYLDLYCSTIINSFSYGGTFLQLLQALTCLVDLQVSGWHYQQYTRNMLSGLCSLTRLALAVQGFDPVALAGKTQLCHLQLPTCSIAGGAAGIAQLLSQLQHLTQLTHLELARCMQRPARADLPAASYSALTASSELQHLDIHQCFLPAGAWQHVFPAGRQLPHLQSLVIDRVTMNSSIAAPGSSLVSCCPALQLLTMQDLQCSKELLGALPRLSRLTGLQMGVVDGASGREVLEQLCQLTGLMSLGLDAPSDPQGLLLLAQLRHLTYFRNADWEHMYITSKVKSQKQHRAAQYWHRLFAF